MELNKRSTCASSTAAPDGPAWAWSSTRAYAARGADTDTYVITCYGFVYYDTLYHSKV